MTTLARATLRFMLTSSLEEDIPVPHHEDQANILRLRVLDGEDLSAEEMLYICNQIRQGRRTAEPTPKSTRARKVAAVRTPEVLTDLLDIPIGDAP